MRVCVLLHEMFIRIFVQDKCVGFCSPRIFEDIGGLRGCKSLVPNRWGVFEPSLTLVEDKLSILVRECNLVEKQIG